MTDERKPVPFDRGGHRPARGRSRPPFAPGNTAAMTHGARSPRIVAPLAAAIAQEATERVEYLRRPEFAMAVEDWSWHEAQRRLLQDYLDTHAPLGLNERGRQVPAAERLDRVARRADNLRAALGLTPAAAAKVGASLAQASRVDLARVWSAQSGPPAHVATVAEPVEDGGDAGT